MNDFYLSLLTASFFILFLILLRAIFSKKISMRLQYALWLPAAVKLLVFPVPHIESPLSVMNLSPARMESMQDGSAIRSAKNSGKNNDAKNADAKNADAKNTDADHPDADTSAAKRSASQNAAAGISAQKPGAFAYLQKAFFEKTNIRRMLRCAAAAGSIAVFLYFLSGNILLAAYLRRHRTRFPAERFPLPVYLTEKLPAPCLFGKAVYLPPDAAADAQQLACILAHEYCHYRHGDLLWSVVRCLCITCYWWNPLVWLAAYLSKQDCELACDEAALKLLGESGRLCYGRTLIALIRVRPQQKRYLFTAITIIGGRNMKQRIKRIAKNPKTALPACILAAFLTGLCFISISTSRPAAKTDTQPQQADAQASRSSQADTQASRSSQADAADEKIESPKNTDHTSASAQRNAAAGQNENTSLSEEDTAPVFSLDKAVSLAVLSQNKDRYTQTECCGEGHLLLTEPPEPTVHAETITLYLLTQYGEYQFQDGNFIKAAGSGIIPAVMTFSYDSRQGYVLKSYQEPEDGGHYLPSIYKLFPEQLWEDCTAPKEEYQDDITKQERAYAKRYLKQIGRKAKIGDYSDFTHPLLTEKGISVKVSNKMSENKDLCAYPYWIGNQEKIEKDGIRYIYELRLNQDKTEIIYEKREYDTGNVVQRYRFDAATGRKCGS